MKINEVDPRNFDSDIDYYNALNAKPKARTPAEPRLSPSQQAADDEDAISQKRQAADKAFTQKRAVKYVDQEGSAPNGQKYNKLYVIQAQDEGTAAHEEYMFDKHEWGAKKVVDVQKEKNSDGSVTHTLYIVDNHKYGMWKPWKEQPKEEGVAEGAQVDSLVTDALKIMKGPELSHAVAALKTVLGDREYNGRRGFYNFYIKQIVDMYNKQGVAEGSLNEFAPPGSGDGGDDGFSEETLKRLAAQWYNGDEDPRVERTLMAAGWEIGQDEGYDDEPGVFVVQAGDVNGNSYMSWPAHELQQGVAEGDVVPFKKPAPHIPGYVASGSTHFMDKYGKRAIQKLGIKIVSIGGPNNDADAGDKSAQEYGHDADVREYYIDATPEQVQKLDAMLYQAAEMSGDEEAYGGTYPANDFNSMNEQGVAEGEQNPTDVICVDVPLFIRLMEYAREDAQTDMDLHDVAERLTKLSASGETVTMSSYDDIVGSQTEIKEADMDLEQGRKNIISILKAAEQGQDAQIMVGDEPITLEYPEARFVGGRYKSFMKAGRQEEFLRALTNPRAFDRIMTKMRAVLDKQKNFRGSVPGERSVDEGVVDAVKAGAKKAFKALTGPDDEELIQRLEKETGGKRPEKKNNEKVKENFDKALVNASAQLKENEYFCMMDKQVKLIPEGYKRNSQGFLVRK